MALNSEFAEILKRKMGNTPSPPSKNSAKSDKNQGFSWQPIPIFTPQFTWNPTKIPAQYPKNHPKVRPSKTAPQSTPKALAKEPVYSLGQLGLELSGAFITLTQAGADLQENKLSLSILKKQYRKLARNLHPDMNKSATAKEMFQECAQAYSQIEEALVNMSKNS